MAKPRNYVGRCIYCDSTENLSREHIIPEGIGGRIAPVGSHEALVLRDATCEACRAKTMAIEGQVLGKMMGHYRAAVGMVRKDRRTKTRKVLTENGNVVELGIEQLPGTLLLPWYGKPGFIDGRPIGSPMPMRLQTVNLEAHRLPRTEERLIVAGCGPDIFAQMIAKIALGFVVANIGLDSFRPLVRELILGDKKQFGHWVGGEALTSIESLPPEPDQLHNLDIAYILHEGRVYVVGGVWLFAIHGGPRNYVIVGEYHGGPAPIRRVFPTDHLFG